MIIPNAARDSAKNNSANGRCTDKNADVLQAMFQHYANVGLDHQRQAATTSNILLVVSGAILTLVGLDTKLEGVGDALAAAAVAIIGGFGMVWSWKQHEKYAYWTNIAAEYERELSELMAELQTESDLKGEALCKTAEEFGDFATYKLQVRTLWVTLHGVVMALGTLLAIALLWIAGEYVGALLIGSALVLIMFWILRVVVNTRDLRASADSPPQPAKQCQ